MQWWYLNLKIFEKVKLYMKVHCCCMSDAARLGKTDISGDLQDPELDVFMVEILVYSIIK